MFYLRPANHRGHTYTEWLNSYHSFSFGQYYDSRYMGFSDLRVINDDVIAPDGGFDTHPHDNMEIVSIVISGRLKHKDSLGHESELVGGDVQTMTAGRGIEHSEFNPSEKEPVHFLQIWIIPQQRELEPDYQQRRFADDKTDNNLCLLVSPDAAEESLPIRQDARIYRTRLEAEKTVDYSLDAKRAVWIQMISGAVEVSGNLLVGGDGLAVYKEDKPLRIRGVDTLSDFILCDLRG